jgi:thiamine kinase-like enzyme
VVAAALHRAADPGLPADLLTLGARLPGILDQLEALPLTYAHGDASPQNLLLPADDPDTVVVIDWGFGSLLPVGFDLGQLLAGLMHAGQAEPSELPGIDAVIFPAYLDGLRTENYDADPGQVREGYVGSLAAWSALCALPAELLASATPGEETEALFLQRLQLTRAMVNMAAEI